MSPDTQDKTRTFDEVVRELEKVVERLEGNQVPLEEGLSLYEKGVRLAREAEQILDNARTRLKELTSRGIQDSEIGE